MDIYFDRIKPLFDKSGKADAELERDIGIPPKKISQWNIRYTKSYTKYIPQIASYFNVSTDYLLGNTDDPRPISAREVQAKPTPTDGGGLSAYDAGVLNWFHSLPPEKRQAILSLGDAPKELLGD